MLNDDVTTEAKLEAIRKIITVVTFAPLQCRFPSLHPLRLERFSVAPHVI